MQAPFSLRITLPLCCILCGACFSRPPEHFTNGSLLICSKDVDRLNLVDPALSKPVTHLKTAYAGATNIAVDPITNRAYVSYIERNLISVIDLATSKVLNSFSTGIHPAQLVIVPQTRRLYVSCPNDNAVLSFNLDTSIVEDEYPVASPFGMDISSDQHSLYVVSPKSNTLSIINLTTGAIIRIGLDYTPWSVAASPYGTKVYIGNVGCTFVTIVDIKTRIMANHIRVAMGPHAITFDASGTWAYVANNLGNNVSVIDTRIEKVTSSIDVGLYPIALTLSRDGHHLYVANYGDKSVSVIDPKRAVVKRTIAVDAHPSSLCALPL
jgi:YVTN family beta-propeller protein